MTLPEIDLAGVEFDTRLVRFTHGDLKSTEFKRIGPKGKVPAQAHPVAKDAVSVPPKAG